MIRCEHQTIMSFESPIEEEINTPDFAESFDANERNYPIAFEGGFEPVSREQIDKDVMSNPEILDSIIGAQSEVQE